jgi:predicted Zn-dependent protease/phosphatidylglycerophosphate synthase
VALSAEFLGRFYSTAVTTRGTLPLSVVPASARRNHPSWGMEQALAPYVLDEILKPRLPRDAAVSIAFTTCDLWPGPGWNFVFGQASLHERVGVWSLYRNGDPEEGPAAFRLCLLRTLKTAVHEVGHMFSIQHCTAYECGMCGSNHREESDRRPLWFCPECQAKVCWATGADPATRYRQLPHERTGRGGGLLRKIRPRVDFGPARRAGRGPRADRTMKFTIPNVLSLFRIVAGPILLGLAWKGYREAFTIVFGLALLSDAVDGFLARRLHATTELGARLDSIGDMVITAMLPLSVFWLLPELIREEMPFIVTAMVSYLLPSAVGVLRFGRLTSYHTYGAKFCAVTVGLSLFVTFCGGPFTLFKLLIPLMVLEGLEELAITAVLPAWRADVHTLWHAWRIRQAARAEGGR